MLRLFLVLAVMGYMGISSIAKAAPSCRDESSYQPMRGPGDDFTPWPSRLIRPFPWDDVQGLWMVEDTKSGDTWYFALKRLRVTPTCERPLQVSQIDGSTCRVTATGVGYDRNRVVRAQMTTRTGKTFRVAFTAFRVEDAPIVPIQGKIHIDSVVVLSMADVDSPLQSEVHHMQIVKVSNYLDLSACSDEIKK
jgi:hypothetical protein